MQSGLREVARRAGSGCRRTAHSPNERNDIRENLFRGETALDVAPLIRATRRYRNFPRTFTPPRATNARFRIRHHIFVQCNIKLLRRSK